jgi:hypothetical protein
MNAASEIIGMGQGREIAEDQSSYAELLAAKQCAERELLITKGDEALSWAMSTHLHDIQNMPEFRELMQKHYGAAMREHLRGKYSDEIFFSAMKIVSMPKRKEIRPKYERVMKHAVISAPSPTLYVSPGGLKIASGSTSSASAPPAVDGSGEAEPGAEGIDRDATEDKPHVAAHWGTAGQQQLETLLRSLYEGFNHNDKFNRGFKGSIISYASHYKNNFVTIDPPNIEDAVMTFEITHCRKKHGNHQNIYFKFMIATRLDAVGSSLVTVSDSKKKIVFMAHSSLRVLWEDPLEVRNICYNLQKILFINEELKK